MYAGRKKNIVVPQVHNPWLRTKRIRREIPTGSGGIDLAWDERSCNPQLLSPNEIFSDEYYVTLNPALRNIGLALLLGDRSSSTHRLRQTPTRYVVNNSYLLHIEGIMSEGHNNIVA
jgi:hypothetical protein